MRQPGGVGAVHRRQPREQHRGPRREGQSRPGELGGMI